jgi:ribonuclease ZC3H12
VIVNFRYTQRSIKYFLAKMKSKSQLNSSKKDLLKISKNGKIRKTRKNMKTNLNISDTGSKRLILLDAFNISYRHGDHQSFSVEGLLSALNYFENLGYEVKGVLPKEIRPVHRSKCTNLRLLQQLRDDGKIIESGSCDDCLLLELCSQRDGVIISNDNFREFSDNYRTVISSRVVGYAFCYDHFMLPIDPYGPNGPLLKSILYK